VLVFLPGGRGLDLLARLVVVRRPLHLTEDADRRLVQDAGVGEPGEREGRGRVLGVGVVDEQVGHVHPAVGRDLDDLDATTGGPGDPLAGLTVLAGVAEPDRLTLDQRDDRIGLRVGVLDRVERAVVIVRATKVDSAPNASETGLNGWSTDPAGVDLVTLPGSEVGEYCPLVRP
jgi:hypothetical protein